MSLWRQLTRGIRALVHRSAADRDIADEVAALPRGGRGGIRGARAVAGGCATSRATGDRQRRRPCASRCARTVGTHRRDDARRRATRRATDAPLPGFTRGSVLDVGARHRRQHGDLQRRQSRSCFSHCPIPMRDRLMMIWDGQGGSRLGCDVRHVSRAHRSGVARSNRWRSCARCS